MPIPENLSALHRLEEAIREQSLQVISDDEGLSDHLQAVHDAIDHLTELIRLDADAGTDEHTLQLISIRLLNNAACVLRVGLAGYYQVGFQLMREMLELVNLIDYFSLDPNRISLWRTADESTSRKVFSAVNVRRALEKDERFRVDARQKLYKTFSNMAGHPRYEGFRLIAPDNSPKVGSFFDRTLLGALLVEAGRHLSHTTITLSLQIQRTDDRLLHAKARFIHRLQKYKDKYI